MQAKFSKFMVAIFNNCQLDICPSIRQITIFTVSQHNAKAVSVAVLDGVLDIHTYTPSKITLLQSKYKHKYLQFMTWLSLYTLCPCKGINAWGLWTFTQKPTCLGNSSGVLTHRHH